MGEGNALGLDETLSGDASAVAGYEREFFAQPPSVAAAVLVLFLVALLFLAGASLNRRTTEA